jgi:DNA-binding response OmpR family regulator
MILLIEDHAPTSNALQKLLRMARHEVVAVRTLGAARAMLAIQSFTLIVSDITLPDGSALELMREFGERKPCPAIALTGSLSTVEHKVECTQVGFDLCLQKPIDFDTLTRAIEQLARLKPPCDADRGESAGA